MNGIERKLIVNCYITLAPYAAEPQLQPGQSWWQTLPPTRTRESNRNKRVQQTIEKEIADDDSQELDAKQPECSQQQEQMQIDYTYDPWEDKKIPPAILT